MRSLLQIIALTTLSLSLGVAAAPEGEPALVKRADPQPQGCDVSQRDGEIDWARIKYDGGQFAYIKATEGTTSTDTNFDQNYNTARANGLIRGAYHTARPDLSDGNGVAQAKYFMNNGAGGWTDDDFTLPGALELGGNCASLTPAQMVSWIQDFSGTYQAATKRYPVIYTTTSWWSDCTGNSAEFRLNRLWMADSVNPLPASWSSYTFLQYDSRYSPFPGNADSFNGNADDLSGFASGKAPGS